MPATQNKYLYFVDSIQLDTWSVKTVMEAKFDYSNKHEFARIGDFLIKNRTPIDIHDNKMYSRITVKINNNGVFLRDRENGFNIGTKKQYLARAGQFIISKIDARNGAFGIVPKDLNGAIVTNDFPLFDVNHERINIEFLLLVTTTDAFIKFAQSSSSGTTNRQRMDIDSFLNQKIPLPSLQEQNRIVNNYNEKSQETDVLLNKIETLESEIENYLDASLGISHNSDMNIKRGLHFVKYGDIDKWSLDDIFKKHTVSSTKYPLTNLNSICSLITDGTHQTPTYYQEGVIFLSAKNVTKEVIDWENIKFVSKDAHEEYIKRVKPEVGDILLAKNGTTGVAAIIELKREFSIYVSLALLKPKRDLVFPYYLLHLINSKIARAQFSARLIGIGVPNLHLGEIKEVLIPLPPLNEQILIANKITALKNEIRTLKQNIDLLRIEAKNDFEQTIFN